ncbi:UbiH 2-polyprenyl-6-methoxyphenol hydroxylase and related FAD-dependent oxidoreductases [Paracoccaceae bacterium]|jgi:p-hydroxybenzoate 3-monooxygenase
MQRQTTQVAIVGAGPAGMILALLLRMQGIDCVVLERRARAEVLARIRAGVLEPAAARFLRESGLVTRIDSLGRPRNGSRIAWQDRPSLMIDVKRWTGTEMMAYGQTFLTEDLYAQADQLDLRLFEQVTDLDVTGLDGQRPKLEFRTPEGAIQLDCDFVIGCDGARGQCAGLIPEANRRTFERDYPFGWLGIMVEAPPIDDFTYIHHAEGFALAAQRGPNLSRYYVQTPLDQGVEAWPDDRFWKTFLHRAPADIAAEVVTGPSIEKSLAPLRSRVIEPMRWGRLFLAGDAAHVVPPTGAKGLNLAISDIRLLSRALIARYVEGRSDLLDSYSGDALRRVWAASNLSWRLTRLLHVFPGEPSIDARLRQCDYDQLLESDDLQRALARDYAGTSLSEGPEA